MVSNQTSQSSPGRRVNSRLDWIFTREADEIRVDDQNVAMEELKAQFGKDLVYAHVTVWQLLSASLTDEVDKGILFREHSSRAARDALLEARNPKAQGAGLG